MCLGTYQNKLQFKVELFSHSFTRLIVNAIRLEAHSMYITGDIWDSYYLVILKSFPGLDFISTILISYYSKIEYVIIDKLY